MNFNWGSGAPAPGVNINNYSVRWTGKIEPRYSQTYTFYLNHEDGARLWVNNQLLINQWNTSSTPVEHSATITLQAGQRYDIRVESGKTIGSAVAQLSWSSPSQPKEIVPQSQLFTTPAAVPTGSGTGLLGNYYDDYTSATGGFGTFVLSRIDPALYFNWGTGSPDPLIAAETFTVRWTGQVEALRSEMHTFYLNHDDGVRLWVNGQLVIDAWNSTTRDHSGTIALQAGQRYDIRLEYYENGTEAYVRLFWSSATQAKVLVPSQQLYSVSVPTNTPTITPTATPTNTPTVTLTPTPTVTPGVTISNGLRAQFFENTNLTELLLQRTDPTVNFTWGGAPTTGVGADDFSVRWLGQVEAVYSQTYTFYTQSDDGVRLWVNNQLLVDNWTAHGSTTNSGTIALTAGQRYDIKLEFYEGAGQAVIQLSWSSPSQSKQVIPQSQLYDTAPPIPLAGSGIGLQGVYFNNNDLTGQVTTRIDSNVNFTWGSSPVTGVDPDTFSVRWTGRVLPQYSETYTFYTHSDDGVRLWVNGQQVINNWTPHGLVENSGSIPLVAGQWYDIKLEYFDNTSTGVIKLYWESTSQLKQLIPQTQLTTP